MIKMYLNAKPPYKIFNGLTKKEKDLFTLLWPKIEEALNNRFKTKFQIDYDYNLYYEEREDFNKEDVMTQIDKVFHDYYFGE